ncbi:hypothetical protein N9878_01305 [bacterium]|nr:hypothetical protein [bacterium]
MTDLQEFEAWFNDQPIHPSNTREYNLLRDCWLAARRLQSEDIAKLKAHRDRYAAKADDNHRSYLHAAEVGAGWKDSSVKLMAEVTKLREAVLAYHHLNTKSIHIRDWDSQTDNIMEAYDHMIATAEGGEKP